jgi:hypothetical protein
VPSPITQLEATLPHSRALSAVDGDIGRDPVGVRSGGGLWGEALRGSRVEGCPKKLSDVHVCKRLETGRLQCARKLCVGRPEIYRVSG